MRNVSGFGVYPTGIIINMHHRTEIYLMNLYHRIKWSASMWIGKLNKPLDSLGSGSLFFHSAKWLLSPFLFSITECYTPWSCTKYILHPQPLFLFVYGSKMWNFYWQFCNKSKWKLFYIFSFPNSYSYERRRICITVFGWMPRDFLIQV